MNRLQAFFDQRDALHKIEAYGQHQAEASQARLDDSHAEDAVTCAGGKGASPVIVALGEAVDPDSDAEAIDRSKNDRITHVSKIQGWPTGTDGWDTPSEVSPTAKVSDHISAYNRGAISERSQHTTGGSNTTASTVANVYGARSSQSAAGAPSQLRFWIPRSSDDTPRQSAKNESANLFAAYRGQDPLERQERRHLRHLDIPAEDFVQFKEFAKELVEHVHLECAPSNPYVQALTAHRLELSQGRTIDDETDSLAMRLATRRHDALAMMEMVDEPHTPCAASGKTGVDRMGGAGFPVVWPPLNCIRHVDGLAIDPGLTNCTSWDLPAEGGHCSGYIYRQSPEDIPLDTMPREPRSLQPASRLDMDPFQDEHYTSAVTHEADVGYLISHL